MNKNNSATSLRILLLTMVILMSVVIVGGFFFASNWLSSSASESKTKSYTTVSSNLSNSEIINLQDDVLNHQIASMNATSLVGSGKNFENNIHQDLSKYAADIGISITNISLTQKPSFMTTDIPVTGVLPQFVSITLDNPVQFSKLFELIQAIESNIPKMKITGISMDSVAGQNDSVAVKPIIIEAYTK